MSYKVKECFYTLQGEGAQAGRAAVFLRFTGCNLWSGREEDRRKAICRFCDTDFVGTDGENGGRYTQGQVGNLVQRLWEGRPGRPLVVCTGGEPLLQLDGPLIAELHARGFEIAIETNGTLPVPDGIDWVCLSPKAGAPVVLDRADELKLVYPQPEAAAQPDRWVDFPARHHFLQPKDETGQDHTASVVAYCLAEPRWRLGIQMHKVVGVA